MDQTPRYRDEIDFKELLQSPRKLFAYSYIYVLIALLSLGLYYINRLNAVGSNVIAPVMLPDSSVLASDIPMQTPAVLPPVDIMAVSLPTDSILTKGRELYKANCASCHGDNGVGDGPAGLALNPRPRNFQNTEGWTNGPKLSQIYKTLEEGIVRNAMASYNYMPPADRIALAHVVRSYIPGPPVDSKEELMALEMTYQLAKGVTRPGQIPIRKAAGLYVMENGGTTVRVISESAVLEASDDPGARLLKAAVRDPQRAVRSLSSLGRSIAGPGDLMKTVTADPALMGFSPTVSAFTADEWESVYRYLSARGIAGKGK